MSNTYYCKPGWEKFCKAADEGLSNPKSQSYCKPGWESFCKAADEGLSNRYTEDGQLKQQHTYNNLSQIEKDGWRRVPDSEPPLYTRPGKVGSYCKPGFESFCKNLDEAFSKGQETKTASELLREYTPKHTLSYDGDRLSWPNLSPSSQLPDYTMEVGTLDSPTSLFFPNLDLSYELDLNLSNVFDEVFREFDLLQRDLFYKIPLDAQGFLNFSFLPFVQPVSKMLEAAATTPEMVFKNIPILSDKLAVDLVKLKNTIDEAYSKQITLSDLMPDVMKCSGIDMVLYDTTMLPEAVQQFLSQIKGGILGPLHTLYESLTYHVEAVTQDFLNSSGISSIANAIKEGSQYIANIAKLAGMVPYMMAKIKEAIVFQLKEFAAEAIENIPFVNNLKYLTRFLHDTKQIINDLFQQVAPIIDCIGAFGGRDLANILSRQSELTGLFRDAVSNPLTQFTSQVHSFISMRENILFNAIDKSAKLKEKTQAQSKEMRKFTPNDIVSNVLNNADLYEFSSINDTWRTFEYKRLLSLDSPFDVKFREEMIWQISSEIINHMKEDFVDNSLTTLYHYLNSIDDIKLTKLIEEINAGTKDFNIDKSNLLLYRLLADSHNITDTHHMINTNIVDALTFASTYFINIDKKDLVEVFNTFKKIIERGHTLGSFNSEERDEIILYLKTNYINELSERERVRFYSLLELTPTDELKKYIDYFKEVTNNIPSKPPTYPTYNFTIDYEVENFESMSDVWQRET